MNPHDKFYKVQMHQTKTDWRDYALAVAFALALLAMLAFFM